MARYKEWVHQEVMRLGDPISVKIQFGSWTVSHSLWITDHCPWPNPLRASPEDGFSFNDFKTNLDFRMLPSAVFPGKNFKMGFEVTLKHHFPLYGTKYAVSIEKRSLVDLKLDFQKRQNFWDFLSKNTKNYFETHKKYRNHFLYLLIRYRQKLFFEKFCLFWELSLRSTIENRSVLEAIFTLFSIENHIPRRKSYHEHSKCTNIQSDWQCMHDISINWVIHLQKTSKRLVSSRIKVIQGHNDMTHFLLFG